MKIEKTEAILLLSEAMDGELPAHLFGMLAKVLVAARAKARELHYNEDQTKECLFGALTRVLEVHLNHDKLRRRKEMEKLGRSVAMFSMDWSESEILEDYKKGIVRNVWTGDGKTIVHGVENGARSS